MSFYGTFFKSISLTCNIELILVVYKSAIMRLSADNIGPISSELRKMSVKKLANCCIKKYSISQNEYLM